MKKTKVIFYNRNDITLKADKRKNKTFVINYMKKGLSLSTQGIKTKDIYTLFQGNVLTIHVDIIIADYPDVKQYKIPNIINIELNEKEKNALLNFIKEIEEECKCDK